MQREIGTTGILVRALGLGGMPLSIAGRSREPDALKVIAAFVDQGGDFIDTANVYCLDNRDIGHNERLIAKAMQQLGHPEVTIATKGGLSRPAGRWITDGRPSWIRASCEQSLCALGVECITLYQLHAIDSAVPLSETLGEMLRLQDEGKIRHIGLSNVDADQLELGLSITTVATVQNRCNIFAKRDLDSGLVALCRKLKISYLPYSPVGGHTTHQRLMGNRALCDMAARRDISSYMLALAWLLHQGDHIIPIPGASRTESVAASTRALEVVLSDSDLRSLNDLAPP